MPVLMLTSTVTLVALMPCTAYPKVFTSMLCKLNDFKADLIFIPFIFLSRFASHPLNNFT